MTLHEEVLHPGGGLRLHAYSVKGLEQGHAGLEEGCGHKYFINVGCYFVKRVGRLVYPFDPHLLALIAGLHGCTATPDCTRYVAD
jgi:hypothetical protein